MIALLIKLLMCAQYSANFNLVHRVSSQLFLSYNKALKDVLGVKKYLLHNIGTYLTVIKIFGH